MLAQHVGVDGGDGRAGGGAVGAWPTGGSALREVRCVGCGAMVPGGDGPIHAYMVSAPGCWERYCSLEDWKSGLTGAASIGIVQDLVDSFAVQHATSTDRRNVRSVAVHLLSLCAGLERGVTGHARRRLIGRWAGRDYPVLDPAPDAFGVTISDVAAAPVPERVGAEDPIRPAQETIRYSWMRPPSRSALRSLARSTSPIAGGVTSGAAGGRCLRDRWGRCAL